MTDTIIIVVVAFWLLSSNLGDKILPIYNRLDKLEVRVTSIEKDLGVIKTVLITKGIMPESFAENKDEK